MAKDFKEFWNSPDTKKVRAGAKAKALKKAKKMKEGHNLISSDGTITNRLYPGGYNGKK